jgi:bifunctional protein hldE
MDFLPYIEKKIAYTAEEASNTISMWRFKNDKIVFTNGCFDILHKGHIEYLAKAASLGTKLIIGLNTDNSVKRLKGASRPVNDEKARALLLASLVFVDEVILFDTDTPYDLINKIQPDVLVKGGDYKPEDIVGYDIVKAKGGEVVTLDFIEGYSTTSVIERMK